MYAYEWDSSTGGYILTPMPLAFSKEPRPVYYKELDILGFDKYWDYDKNDSFPYMWAEANNYYYRGRLVAKTKGGSLYIPPELVLIEDPEPEGYPLRFVDIPAMVDKNRQLMEQLVQETIKKIYNTFIEYQDKVDVFYVAFSGGKDSVVALDLVQRALPHNCFKVLFGDTGMEFPDTYETVEKIKQICAEEKIEFLQAKSKLKPENTWQIFGPPAVTIRWCCSVHKTTPQIMQLREVLQKPDFTGMAFTGVRGDESLSRSEYDAISYGGKHSGQYSCHPILEWNTAELFLYIYENGLTFNNAYKKGNTRAGCLVCPTARSMFNFIKNDEGEDVKAFQWFIDRYDFSSQNPFVTIDMLWNFFYETGSQKLADGIREVLSCYTQKMDKELMEDEKRVLKVILLLQAISERMSGNRDIFLPNNKNLTLAFEGTDLEFTAQNIAKKLLNDHVVTRTPLTGDVFSYCCKNMGPSVDPGPFIAQVKGKSTKDMSFMAGSNLRTTIEFTGALKLRYSLAYATLSDFDSEIKKANNPSATNNKLYAVATIGRDSAESGALKKKIENFFVNNPESNAIVIDSSTCVLGEGEYNEFVENYAMSLAIGNSDLDQRKTYEGYAIEVLSNWAKRIKCGDFYVYSRYATNGERVANIQDLFIYLLDIDKFHYPQCLEGAYTSVLNTMYDANSLGNGATCGINEETKGTFRSGNEATKLENALKGAWKVPEYWNKKP